MDKTNNDGEHDIEQMKKLLEVEKLRTENEKLKTEHEKLILEKEELKKTWFRKPQWWSALLPTLIGILTLWAAYSTGIFGIQRLQNEKVQLQDTIQKVTLNLKNIRDTILKKEYALIISKNNATVAIKKLKGIYDLFLKNIDREIASYKKGGQQNEVTKYEEFRKEIEEKLRRMDDSILDE